MLIQFLKEVPRVRLRLLLIPILTAILCLSGCVVPQERGVYRPESRPEPRQEPRPGPSHEARPVYALEIEGQWSLNAGNATGRLEFARVRGGFIGRIWFDAYQRWEDLADVQSDPQSGRVEFARPGANEHYSGVLSGNHMRGHYSSRGLSYPWEARRERESGGPPRIDGQWQLYAGNATGRVEFSRGRRALEGRIWFDTYQRWEELEEVSFDPETGRVAFKRPGANEWYVGTASGRQISGSYTVTTIYSWEGRRERRSASASQIDGLWAIHAGNATGRLELYWVRNTLAGRIWFDVYGRWEELTDLAFDRRVARIEFTRPHGRNERYSGTLSGDRISGSYSAEGPTYSWEARR